MIERRRSRIVRRAAAFPLTLAAALTLTLATSLAAPSAFAQAAPPAPAPAPAPADPTLLKPLTFVPDAPKEPDLPFAVVPPVVSRSMTLPLGVLSPSLTVLADRPGARVDQSANVGLGIAVGAGRNTEVAGSITPPSEGVTQMRIGFTFQLANYSWFQWGLRPEIGSTHLVGDDDARVTVLRPGLSLPVAFLLGRFVRIDTGVSFNGFLSTRSEYGFAITSRTVDPSIERPGVPLELTIQLERSFFLGVETGAGLLAKPALIDHGDVEDGFFAPLGFFLGGTISSGDRPFVDIIGAWRFPYYFLGERGLWRDNPWQLGVTMRGFIEL